MGILAIEFPDVAFSEKADTSPKVFIDDPVVRERVVTRTLILCGNCAGEEPRALKTLLTADGRCATCGGSSYILASKVRRINEYQYPDTDR